MVNYVAKTRNIQINKTRKTKLSSRLEEPTMYILCSYCKWHIYKVEAIICPSNTGMFTLQPTFIKGSSFLESTKSINYSTTGNERDPKLSRLKLCTQGASFQNSNHYRESSFCTFHRCLRSAYRNCHRNLCKILSSSC